jgi:hypothetical protein
MDGQAGSIAPDARDPQRHTRFWMLLRELILTCIPLPTFRFVEVIGESRRGVGRSHEATQFLCRNCVSDVLGLGRVVPFANNKRRKDCRRCEALHTSFFSKRDNLQLKLWESITMGTCTGVDHE